MCFQQIDIHVFSESSLLILSLSQVENSLDLGLPHLRTDQLYHKTDIVQCLILG